MHTNKSAIEEDPELKELLDMTQLYLKKCEGKQIIPKLYKHTNVNILNLPPNPNLYYKLKSRLNTILRYNLKDKDLIKRIILSAITRYETLRPRELAVLKSISENPNMRLREIAEKHNITITGASKIVRRLKEKTGLRFIIYPNYGLFKLKHFLYYFRVKEENVSTLKKLLKSPWLISFNLSTISTSDIVYGWASFIIPNQKQVINDFIRFTVALRNVVEKWERIEISGMATGLNLNFYDGERWYFDEVSWTFWLLNQIKETPELFPRANVVHYSNTPMNFTRPDFLIFSRLLVDANVTIYTLKEILGRLGYSRSTSYINSIRKKIFSLIPKCIMIDGLGLRDMLVLFIQTADPEKLDILYRFFSQFPLYVVYTSPTGIYAAIFLPEGKSLSFYYMFELLKREFEEVIMIPIFRNIGSGFSEAHLVRMWDEKRQIWDVGRYFIEKIKQINEYGF